MFLSTPKMASFAVLVFGLAVLVASSSACGCGGSSYSGVSSGAGSSDGCKVEKETFTTYCPDGWAVYASTKCFKVVNGKLGQDDAERACNALGGTLASISSDSERLFVNSYIVKEIPSGLGNIWVGGKYIGKNWYWNDHSAYVYSEFWPNQPEFSHGNCVQLATAEDIRASNPPKYGTMAMSDCNIKMQYLCQRGQEKKTVTKNF